jgi:tripartite-type tricarboxylate transporter receptor subunit TctC
VPTHQQTSIRGLAIDQWHGAFVPAGTPPAIVGSLNTEINKARTDAGIREKFLSRPQEPVGALPNSSCAFSATTISAISG